MPDSATLLTFVAIAALFAAVPGPSNLFVVSHRGAWVEYYATAAPRDGPGRLLHWHRVGDGAGSGLRASGLSRALASRLKVFGTTQRLVTLIAHDPNRTGLRRKPPVTRQEAD
jgi:hypothetical protein